jgi:peptidoglycan/xylan/chitin deacetylase (PgdA/CDA1 family)
VTSFKKVFLSLGKKMWEAAVRCDAFILPRMFYRRKLIILFYHGVARDPASQPQHGDGRHVRLEKFRRQMEYVKRKYRVLSLEAAMDALAAGAQLPPNALVITFDDGYRNNLDDMFPVVRDLEIPVTIFIATDFMKDRANNEYLDWDDARYLHRQGVSFGSHTVSHAHLTNVPDDQALDELVRSKEEIAGRLQAPVLFFAYPYGEHDGKVASLVKSSGYLAACTVRYGLNDAGVDKFLLKRIAVTDNYSFAYFVAALFPGLFSVVRFLLRSGKADCV